MPSNAISKTGESIEAERVAPADWFILKKFATVGDYFMPCCTTPAIPKTSVLELQFFAHLNDECITAPETNWHKEGKAIVLDSFASLGLAGASEVRGGHPGDEWIADTFLEIGDRRIAIELQRSYQTVDEYIARQERYSRHNVDCFWLTRRQNLSAISKVTGRLRMKNEWEGKFPPGQKSFAPLISKFPVSVLTLGESPKIWHVGNTEDSIEDWLRAVIEGRYVYDNGRWAIGVTV